MSDKKLLIKLAADVEGLKRGLRQASQQVDTFTSEIQKMGGVMAAAFSVKAIGNFVLEVTKLSGEAEGVSEAFDRLPNSVKVMDDLKRATHGTVSELDLMKRAVMASNFDISLQALPRLLEFATLRAKQTGQSIDYLVDSIVTGIGRKSKLILDNLGISAVQLTEALGGASTASSTIGEVADAVGKIAEENLKKMGQLSENASTKMERLNANWTNLKVAIGDAANGTGIFGSVVDSLNDRMQILASKNLPAYIKALALMGDESTIAKVKTLELAEATKKLEADQKASESITRQAKQAIATFGDNLKAIESAYKQNINYQKIMNEVNRLLIEDEKKKSAAIINEANLTEKLNGLKEDAILATGKERAALNQQIQVIEKQIQALQKLGIEEDKQTKYQERYEAWLNRVTQKRSMELGDFTHFQTEKGPNEKKDNPISSMQATAEYLSKRLEEAKKRNDKFVNELKDQAIQVATTYAAVGNAIGQGFGDAISGADSFAKAMLKMASQVVNAIEQVVLAKMIEKSFLEGGPTPFAIARAAIGFGLVKALFSKLASAQASSSASNSYSPSRGNGRQVLTASVSGRQLNLVLAETARYDSRTNTTS